MPDFGAINTLFSRYAAANDWPNQELLESCFTEDATFTLHIDGQPAKDLEVTVTAGNTQYRDQLAETKVKTDDKGQFSVTWPTAGMYWIDASTKDNKTTMPQAKERRLSYAATVEVMP